MNLNNRDGLLEELSQALQRPEFHRIVLGVIKVTFFDPEGEELLETGLPEALNLLAFDLWQAADCSDISTASTVTLGIF